VGQGGDAGGAVITSNGQLIRAEPSEDEDDGALKPLPERLVMELTAHRTLALREAIGRSPDVALTLLLLKLVTDTFRTSSASGSCLEASVRHVYMSAQAPDLTIPQRRRSSIKSLAGRLAALEASAGQSAPDVVAPSPARHSLPCPESRLRDQPARGRTTGEPVPPGGFGQAERTR